MSGVNQTWVEIKRPDNSFENVTLSDSSGYIYDRDGIDEEKLAFVMELKNVKETDEMQSVREIVSIAGALSVDAKRAFLTLLLGPDASFH